MKKHDTRLLIGRITFLTCEKSDTRHLIGLHRFANENLLRGFPVCKSQFVYNKLVYIISHILNAQGTGMGANIFSLRYKYSISILLRNGERHLKEHPKISLLV